MKPKYNLNFALFSLYADFGILLNDWYKKKGYTKINNHIVEIHWVEHFKLGKYDGKIKTVLNKNLETRFFFY